MDSAEPAILRVFSIGLKFKGKFCEPGQMGLKSGQKFRWWCGPDPMSSSGFEVGVKMKNPFRRV
jgi:hypothetical protein